MVCLHHGNEGRAAMWGKAPKLACHLHEFGSSSADPRIEFNASAEDEPISGGSLEVES
jgi:hypothetical protein